jgi:hypothetical protein
MRRRKLLVALAGLAVVVAAGAVVLLRSRPNRITRENCDRTKEGMSRAVLAGLGPDASSVKLRPAQDWFLKPAQPDPTFPLVSVLAREHY